MGTDRRLDFVLMLLLAIGTCLVVQVNSTENNCHVLFQGNERCKSRLIGNSCYVHFEGERKTWYDTKTWCLDNYMAMANLPNDSEAYAIAELMSFVGSAYTWLGGRTDVQQNWTFVNGNLLNTTTFPIFQYITTSEGCGVVTQIYRPNNGHRYTDLERRSCNIELPYICRSETNLYHGLYQPITNRKNWFGARQICRDTGGDLFYTNKGERVDQLMSNFARVRKENVTEEFFLGLRREIWKWQDGSEVTNSNWNSNEQIQDFQSYPKNCLMLRDGKLRAEYCYQRGQVICQKELPKSTDITSETPTTLETSMTTTTTQTERLATIEGSTASQGEDLVSNATSKSARMILATGSTISSSPTAAYFTVLAFFGGSLLLLAVAFPLILCLIKRQKKEADDQEMEDHIYCEVAFERIPSQIRPRQEEMRHDAPSITQEHSQQNILIQHQERLNSSMRTPFSRTSVDDVVIMDNHLYGSTEEIVEECTQRRFKIDSPQNPRMYDETTLADNHLYRISEEVPDGESDINEAGSDLNKADTNEA